MITTIAGFGCSWIDGDEIEDTSLERGTPEWRHYREQNCILGRLAQLHGLQADNQGISGGSLTSTRWQFQKWLENNKDQLDSTVIVVGLTESSRESWHDSRPGTDYIHSTNVHSDWTDFVKHWQVNCNTHESQVMRYKHTVQFFDHWSQVTGVPVLMCNVFPAPRTLDAVYRSTDNLRGYLHHMTHQGHDCLAPGFHPNEHGAQLCAEWLSPGLQHLLDN